jgi:hypothetical protein
VLIPGGRPANSWLSYPKRLDSAICLGLSLVEMGLSLVEMGLSLVEMGLSLVEMGLSLVEMGLSPVETQTKVKRQRFVSFSQNLTSCPRRIKPHWTDLSRGWFRLFY